MKSLYLNNFRGFDKTFINISDVNFFVGENSTGKTSVLSMLYLMSSYRFWSEQEFNSPDIELGGFRDMVGTYNKDSDYFQVGYINDEFINRPERCPCFLATFREDASLPKCKEFSYIFNGKQYHVKTVGNNTYYKIEETPEASIRDIFTDWSKNVRRPKNTYKELTAFKNFHNSSFFTIIPNIIAYEEKMQGPQFTSFSIFDLRRTTNDLSWLAPIRTKPNRTYDGYNIEYTPEGRHTPYTLRKLLAPGKAQSRFENALRQFGEESGLFEAVGVHRYGKDDNSPFEIRITLNSKSLGINNVGYGVSQVLPVIVEILTHGKGHRYAIQQPEVHLHPRAQAALGDIIFNLAAAERKEFFIETHSDYMIDRFRLNYKKQDEDKVNAQILFFERTPEGNVAHSIPIQSNGEYPVDQPQAFRAFFVHEQMKILGF